MAGFNAMMDYYDSIGGSEAIVPYERMLGERFLSGLPNGVTLYGLPTMANRVPTFLLNVEGLEAADLGAHMVNDGLAVWAGDTWYSLELYHRLGYETAAVRLGFVHYNTVWPSPWVAVPRGKVAMRERRPVRGGQGCRGRACVPCRGGRSRRG